MLIICFIVIRLTLDRQKKWWWCVANSLCYVVVGVSIPPEDINISGHIETLDERLNKSLARFIITVCV